MAGDGQLRVGVRTLKELALRGCFRISHVITDVGELPYELVEPILKRMPVEQLRTIEANCPQIAQRSEPLWRRLVAKKFGDRPESEFSRKMYAKYEKEEQQRLRDVAERLRQNNLKIQKEKEQKKTIQLDSDPRTEQMKAQKRASKSARPGSRNLQQAYNSARAKGSMFSHKNIQFASMSSMMGTLPKASSPVKDLATESETKARQRALAATKSTSAAKPVTNTPQSQQQTASPIKKAAVRSTAPSIFLRPKR